MAVTGDSPSAYWPAVGKHSRPAVAACIGPLIPHVEDESFFELSMSGCQRGAEHTYTQYWYKRCGISAASMGSKRSVSCGAMALVTYCIIVLLVVGVCLFRATVSCKLTGAIGGSRFLMWKGHDGRGCVSIGRTSRTASAEPHRAS